MIINDRIFGTLYHECGWTNYTTINFLGNELKIDLIVESDEDGLFDSHFMKKNVSLRWKREKCIC
ncbi:hypothetical protein KXS12_03480 [Priestia filamentosa]|uniref:hypothetical protein n=1 Tax=Priestia filamentosa TaxID=1402861 RepID=UPI003F18266F